MERIQDFLLQAQVAEKQTFITSSATVTTYQMKPQDRFLKVILSNGNNMAVKLPPVAECIGMHFAIEVHTDGGASCSVADYGDAGTAISATLADAEDQQVYYSDGRQWHLMASAGVA